MLQQFTSGACCIISPPNRTADHASQDIIDLSRRKQISIKFRTLLQIRFAKTQCGSAVTMRLRVGMYLSGPSKFNSRNTEVRAKKFDG